MNDLNKGSKGDGSTAYIVLAEQVAGGVMPKQVVEGTLDLQKAEDAAIRLRRLAADEHFPQEARDRMLREAIKHEEAVDWAESYSTRMAHGEPPSLDDLPRWATEYRDTLEDLR